LTLPLSEVNNGLDPHVKNGVGAVFVSNNRPRIERSLIKRYAHASNLAGLVGIPSLPVGCW